MELIIGAVIGTVIASVHNYIDFGEESVPYRWIFKPNQGDSHE